MQSQFTQGGVCQCVYPEDCGDCRGCGAGISATDLPTPFGFGHSRHFSERLISTCEPECGQVNFDFGNGYNWLASDWPYMLDKCGPPVFVVLPPRRVLRFCINRTTPADYGSGYLSDEYEYVYLEGGCSDCPDSGFADPKESRSADQLRYQLSYAEDQFTLKDSQGGVWRFVGFDPARVERGRFRSFQSGTLSVQVVNLSEILALSGPEWGGVNAFSVLAAWPPKGEWYVFAVPPSGSDIRTRSVGHSVHNTPTAKRQLRLESPAAGCAPGGGLRCPTARRRGCLPRRFPNCSRQRSCQGGPAAGG